MFGAALTAAARGCMQTKTPWANDMHAWKMHARMCQHACMLAELPACMQGYMHACMHALFAGDVYVRVHVQVYKYFGLETNTIDFVGHAVALYPSDEWVLHASTLLLYFTVSSLCLSCLKAYIYIYTLRKKHAYIWVYLLCVVACMDASLSLLKLLHAAPKLGLRPGI